ncbi:MAG: protein-L-isoaspartate O-methyltransferase family protein [Syntrophobacteraceae bacterium]
MKAIQRKRELSVLAPNVRTGVFCLAVCLASAVTFNPFDTARARAQQTVAVEQSPGQIKSPCPEISWKSSKEFEESIRACRKNEDTKYLEQRYSRALVLMNNKDLVRDSEIRAFLLTPREKFCRPWNLSRAYDHAYLDIHYGVTISGPHLVGRMTSALDVQPGEKVLEIGTGSGYHSAMLSNLTDKIYTVEIIAPLAKETDGLYEHLANSGYLEYAKIKRKSDDGYYGWEEFAPFDKIIVTCGIDHIPPPLLKQLKVGGVMIIPVGPPGAQVILKVSKKQDEQGNIVISREDIYHGRKKEAFVPLTNKEGGTHFK